MAKNVLSIPAGVPFAKTLAQTLLEDTAHDPAALAHYRIFLPTRRACRTLQETFLDLSNGKPLLLPRLLTLGYVDEEELSLSITGRNEQSTSQTFLNLPPAIPAIRRQALLTQLIQKIDIQAKTPPQAFALAGALGRLMDQIYTENLSLSDLDKLAPEEFATHWQITTDFLKILSEHWPNILAEQGVIDGADRRNRLMLALAQHWQEHPPKTPIIAAGSTGSIPATATFLDTIASLPQGRVILPGLDHGLDEESWGCLEESHPQFGLRALLKRMNIDRTDVQTIGTTAQTLSPRAQLASTLMRPASTTHQWRHTTIDEAALQDLSLITCTTEQEEATVIATLMRETLQEPEKTVTLITPDRNLARRVSAICQRWGISVDDSAGTPLHKSPTGNFLNLILNVLIENFAPVPLLALLKHPFCTLDMNRHDLLCAINDLEHFVLRGVAPRRGIESLNQAIENAENETQTQLPHVLELCQKLHDTLKRVTTTSHNSKFYNFNELMKNHLAAAEEIAANMNRNGAETLWRGEAGEAVSALLSELMQHNVSFSRLTLESYRDILEIIFSAQTVRPRYGMHPRIKILGQIEARLVDADCLILSGLNEGTWPAPPSADPWMSQPMRKEFGLPIHERAIGLAAHDFVQGFCAKRVVMTRAERLNSTPQVPARWLQRLKTVLESTQMAEKLDTQPHIRAWAMALDKADKDIKITRPAPCPPLHARPKKLSVTQIETWLQDPYSIYARHILRLKKLDPIDMQNDAATKGTLIHDIFEKFITAHPKNIPENADEILDTFTQNALDEHISDPSLRSFWSPRIYRLKNWFLNNETLWRENVTHCNSEIKGKITLTTPNLDFTLTARADRIDQMQNAQSCTENEPPCGAIIDYKSGGTYSTKDIAEMRRPQLPLEALILQKGGFENIPAMTTSYLGYWIMSGATPPARITKLDKNLDEIVQHTEDGLTTLIDTFANDQTPYYALPDLDNAPRFHDYAHLERVKEWAVTSNDDAAGGEAA